MFTVARREIEWGGKPLIIETGLMARQADGAVLVTYGGTQVLCTAVFKKKVAPGQDFFPLTVNYQEKFFSVGKIPGGFLKREGRPSEHEVLVSRLIDRPIRPLFPEEFRNETQVITTVLSHDLETQSDIAAIIGASAALTISGVPFLGPVGAARVGYIDGEFVLNPSVSSEGDSALNLVVAGTSTGVLMVESEAHELDEKVMLDAVTFGFKSFQPVIDMIISLAEECAKAPYELEEANEKIAHLEKEVEGVFKEDIIKAYQITDKKSRVAALNDVKERAVAQFATEEIIENDVLHVVSEIEYNVVRKSILETKKRIDGRGLEDIRPIDCRVGILNRTHGSALFTRGETQALVVTTLGTSQDEQMIDGLVGESRQGFMLHYNFPPYSVGEVGRMGSPGRREIGHGKLAWRAIHPLLPSKEDFSYTLRVVSEVTESNGSSSMATVCGTSLALMEANVPLQKPCAGIAMGLIKEGDQVAVLSDILGDEDHLGDMDFKVAGTGDGITALQMDIKITSVTEDIMRVALDQAKKGRMHILGEMAKVISKPSGKLSDYAPRMESFQIAKEKIREVIGSGGKVIRELCETTGAKIDITDEGLVTVSAVDASKLNDAVSRIQNIVAEIEEGKIYHGTVVKVMEFGAFVNCIGNQDGLVHISELSKDRVENVTDICKEGDKVWVKCIEFDRGRKRVKLSMKCVDQETGQEIA